MWRVMRHGGRVTDSWRCLVETADEQKARDRYHREWLKFRQGAVILLDPEGKVVQRDGAGCWRLHP